MDTKSLFEIRNEAWNELSKLRSPSTPKDKNTKILSKTILEICKLKIKTESEILQCQCCGGRMIANCPCSYLIVLGYDNFYNAERPSTLGDKVCPTCWHSYCKSYTRTWIGGKEFFEKSNLEHEKLFNNWLIERFIPNMLKKLEKGKLIIRCQGEAYFGGGSGNDVNCAIWASEEVNGNFVCRHHAKSGLFVPKPDSSKKYGALLFSLDLAMRNDPDLKQAINELLE